MIIGKSSENPLEKRDLFAVNLRKQKKKATLSLRRRRTYERLANLDGNRELETFLSRLSNTLPEFMATVEKLEQVLDRLDKQEPKSFLETIRGLELISRKSQSGDLL